MINLDEMIKIANFDFKNLELPNRGLIKRDENKNVFEEFLNHIRKTICNEDKHVELFCMYKYGKDVGEIDDSDGTCRYTRAIYNILWARNEEVGYNKFKSSRIFDEGLLLGGDVMNTVQSTLDVAFGTRKEELKKKYNDKKDRNILFSSLSAKGFGEICVSTHQLGNLILVPAYFNQIREMNGLINDYWDRSLAELKYFGCSSTDFIKSEINNYRNFETSDFTNYINVMFLWDYVFVDDDRKYSVKSIKSDIWQKNSYILLNKSGKIHKEEIEIFIYNVIRAIKRRGVFMSAMLKIAVDFREGEYTPNNCKQSWNDWKVSKIYKEIMDKVFLVNEAKYSDYDEVFNAIKQSLNEDMEYCLAIREIITEASNEIYSVTN